MIDDLWYKNGVLYCLSVGTYMDANGDGIGDFKGLSRRLDYLQGLGITTIWLMPFQPSPGKDDGYDISDYYGVNPRYGALGDFVEFTHGCGQRGIRVIIDLVVNHTSDAHPWFRKARSSPGSEYRDWYVWSKRLTQKQPQKGGAGPSLRANGSRECPLDDRLREAIHTRLPGKNWIASSRCSAQWRPRNDGRITRFSSMLFRSD